MLCFLTKKIENATIYSMIVSDTLIIKVSVIMITKG